MVYTSTALRFYFSARQGCKEEAGEENAVERADAERGGGLFGLRGVLETVDCRCDVVSDLFDCSSDVLRLQSGLDALEQGWFWRRR